MNDFISPEEAERTVLLYRDEKQIQPKVEGEKKTFSFCFRPISFGGKWGCSVWFGPTKKAEARFVFLFLGRYASIDKLWSSWAEIIYINFRSDRTSLKNIINLYKFYNCRS